MKAPPDPKRHPSILLSLNLIFNPDSLIAWRNAGGAVGVGEGGGWGGIWKVLGQATYLKGNEKKSLGVSKGMCVRMIGQHARHYFWLFAPGLTETNVFWHHGHTSSRPTLVTGRICLGMGVDPGADAIFPSYSRCRVDRAVRVVI